MFSNRGFPFQVAVVMSFSETFQQFKEIMRSGFPEAWLDIAIFLDKQLHRTTRTTRKLEPSRRSHIVFNREIDTPAIQRLSLVRQLK